MNIALATLHGRHRLVIRVLAPALVAAGVAGCGGKTAKCDKPQAYQSAREVPVLKVPEGLAEPDQSQALVIPEARSEDDPSFVPGPCLDRPPQFFDDAGKIAGSPEAMLNAWVAAWASQELNSLMSFYASSFQPPGDINEAQWRANRERQLQSPTARTTAIADVAVATAGPDRRIARFVQRLGDSSLRKEMLLVREQGRWRIASETVTDIL